MLTSPWMVDHVRKDTIDTFTMELVPEAGENFDFLPGQFNMLYVFGVGEVPISISGDPKNKDRLLHTIRNVGLVTDALNKLRRGAMVGLRGPYGKPWPVDAAEGKDVVIVAGGIGLAPLRPVLYQLQDQRDRFRNIFILYGARTPGDLLYKNDLKKLSADLEIQVRVTVDQGDADWKGMIGVVTPLIQRAPFDPENSVAYVCGPEIMMHFAVRELHKRGVPDEKVYLSMERNMKCAVGHCGHCQFGPEFICKDGPVFRYDSIENLLKVREV